MLDALQTAVFYIGAFVLVLSVVVFVHEFGHFQVARWRGVAVDTFSIGFGRPLASWRDKAGINWVIGSLPLGGYVKFADDADPMSTAPSESYDAPAKRAEARAKGFFHAQPVSTRAAVVAAGPAANFIFSTLVFAALLLAFGRDATSTAELSPRIDIVQAGSPAEKAGIKPGDLVTSVNGAVVASFGDMQTFVVSSPGKPLAFQVLRDGAPIALTVTPSAREGIDEGGASVTRGVLGVGRTTRPEERKVERFNPLTALAAGAGQVWTIISSTVSYIGNIVSGRASAEHLAGPLGIMDQSGKVLEGSLAAGGAQTPLIERIGQAGVALLQWAAILSVAVGFVNLLPVPMLDGGHLLFYGVETARGRPLSLKAQEMGFRAGLAFIASLFLFATWNDLQRLNVLEFLSGILS
ncbi:MAG: M50 family metallopeptidase [Caulobacterales bacterium]